MIPTQETEMDSQSMETDTILAQVPSELLNGSDNVGSQSTVLNRVTTIRAEGLEPPHPTKPPDPNISDISSLQSVKQGTVLEIQ